MKRLTLYLAAAVLVLTSCAATFRVTGTAPTQENEGSCTIPALLPMVQATAVRVHLVVTGPTSWSDSVLVNAGQSFAFARQVSPGAYSARVWASVSGKAGCDTTIAVNVTAVPWRVRLTP